MSYRENYENWLNSPALSQEEKAELEAIRMDEKEIESRFFDQLAFGTAGLRGTMGVGLYRMNVHVIRHATQAFAQVILEEGPEAAARGVALPRCDDGNATQIRWRNHVFGNERVIFSHQNAPTILFRQLDTFIDTHKGALHQEYAKVKKALIELFYSIVGIRTDDVNLDLWVFFLKLMQKVNEVTHHNGFATANIDFATHRFARRLKFFFCFRDQGQNLFCTMAQSLAIFR